MNISVFGLGYVGCVTSACFANLNNNVIGIDIKEDKVNKLVNGELPIYEKGLNELLNKPDVKRRLDFTTDSNRAINSSDISFVCVGTPSLSSGKINTEYIENVASNIGEEIKNKNDYHLIVIRSTLFPGLIHSNIIPILEKTSGKKCYEDFGIAMNPEFLREGSAIDDFLDPHKIIIGGDDEKSINKLRQLYLECGVFDEKIIFEMSLKEAQYIKYVDNVFHALKVVFANEIGSIAHDLNIDSKKIMNIFCKDKKLNLSPYYLRPGFAFGGSCLPKDLNAFLHYSRIKDYELPLCENIKKSNDAHISRAVDLIQQQKKRNIGFYGLTFKSDTDDMRENPVFSVINKLIEKGYISLWEKGYNIKLFDKTVSEDKFKEFYPQLSENFISSEDEFIKNVEVIVIGNNAQPKRLLDKIYNSDKIIIDLQGIIEKKRDLKNLVTLC